MYKISHTQVWIQSQMDNENALNTRCKCKGEVGSLIIWITYPDTDCNLIQGVNGLLHDVNDFIFFHQMAIKTIMSYTTHTDFLKE